MFLKNKIRILFIVFGSLFSLFFLCFACFGLITWGVFDIFKNFDLSLTKSYTYYGTFTNIESSVEKLSVKIDDKIDDVFDDYIDKYLINDFDSGNFDYFNNSYKGFSSNLNLTLTQNEFFLFIIYILEKNSDYEHSKELLDLIKNNNLMLKIVKDELHVVFPISRTIYTNLSKEQQSKLNFFINRSKQQYNGANASRFLTSSVDFFIRFVFKIDGNKFKLDRYDFNNSWVVNFWVGNDVKNFLDKTDNVNYIYKNFIDFNSLSLKSDDVLFKFQFKDFKIENDKITLNFTVLHKD